MVIYHKSRRQFRSLETPFARFRDTFDARPFLVSGETGSGEVGFIPLAAGLLRRQQIVDAPGQWRGDPPLRQLSKR